VNVRLQVEPDAEAAARAVAERLAEAARAGGHVVLTGGGTPKRAYELAAELEPDWSKAELWWGDERCVPPDDERSNFGMAKQALLDRLEHPPAAVHRIRGEDDPEQAAKNYERELSGVTFDLVLNGLGPDGHTASLFPHAPTLEIRDRLVVAAEAGHEPFVERITLTIPSLETCREMIFLAVGEEKADAARRAFEEQSSPATPASLVRSGLGKTVAVLDEAAAAQLG
jgi:6-phosphogluconolactonase